VDNVEVVYVPQLPAGRYVVVVKRIADRFEEAWDYALTWRIEAP